MIGTTPALPPPSPVTNSVSIDDDWLVLSDGPVQGETIDQTGSRSHVQVRWEGAAFEWLVDAAVRGLLTDYSGTGSIYVHVPPTTTSAPYTRSASQALAKVRASLSLNMSEAARVLGVERPTVYAWLSERAQPNPANMRRLARLAEVAELWDRYHPEPLGGLVRTAGTDGVSLVELLMFDPLPEDRIQVRLASAAEQRRSGEVVRSRTAREVARAYGIQTDAGVDQRREIDRITGRRITAEE